MPSIKQIGTICFLFLISIFPTFADNEPITPTLIPASNPGCNNSVLNTTEGSAALEAIYTPNTINTQWYTGYGENGQAASPTTCSYDGTINLPQTNPSRPGYAFNGWTLRIPPFDLTTLDPTIHATSVQYKAINYGTSSEYNLYSQQTSANADGLSNGEWSANFSYGTIYGRAYCSSRNGDVKDAEDDPCWPSGRIAEWAATADQVLVGRGEHCWCNVTGFAPVNDVRRNVSSTRWIGYFYYFDIGYRCADSYYPSYGVTEEYEECYIQSCEDSCAYHCAMETIYNSSYDYRNTYLPALFGITQ